MTLLKVKMDFINRLQNTALNSAEASAELLQMKEEKIQEILNAFDKHCAEFCFSKIMCFLHVCLYICMHKKNNAIIINKWFKFGLERAKQHPEANYKELHSFEQSCISRKMIPYKDYEDVYMDESEPWEERLQAVVKDLKRHRTEGVTTLFLNVDDSEIFEVSVKRIK